MITPEEMVRRWPYKLGEGPYRIKGVAFAGQREALEKSWRGGLSGFLASVEGEAPELVPFLQQSFLASSFYDVFGLAAIAYHVAKRSGKPFAEMVRRGAGKQVTRDLEGVYRFILTAPSPDRALQRVVTVTNQYFDFAHITVDHASDGSARLARRAFPFLLATWYAPVAEGYFRAALETAGAERVEARARVTPTGRREGPLELCDLELDAVWQTRAASHPGTSR